MKKQDKDTTADALNSVSKPDGKTIQIVIDFIRSNKLTDPQIKKIFSKEVLF